ncbi:acyl carrier protein [Sinorhizobium meliloti]|nr:acyl carrier protein [Sinorhizobium meliloti]
MDGSSNVANRVRAIIIEQLGVDPARATDDASIVDDLGADSLEVAQIVMMIEDEFNIEISDESADAVCYGWRCHLRRRRVKD